ncbi:MAG: FAD-binding protein [Clostridia bacterium]|nr:FAD-binding protein [Clostridia bacterium]
MAKDISRRDFLKRSALGAAGIAAMGVLGGCGSTASTGASTPAPTEAPVEVTAAPVAATSGADRVPGYCGPGNWLGDKPEISDSEISETYDYDIVILGGGHSGLGAAFGAVDALGGSGKVAVIEQQAWGSFVDLEGTGANMGGWYGEDIGHVNSQFLIDRGFGPYNTGEITSEFCKRASGRVNPDIIRGFVQNSGAMFDRYHEIYDMYKEDRLADDGNVYLTGTLVMIDGEAVPDEGYFDMSDMFQYPLCNTQAAYSKKNVSYPIECGGYKTWPCNAQFYGYHGNDIEFVHKYIVRYTQENGTDWYFEHTGVVLVQDADGKVTGLIAQTADGSYVKFNASKGVILCAGDFVGNADMCWALLNEGMEWGERSGSEKDSWTRSGIRAGVGHKMGCWAGGMIEPSPRGWMAIGGGAGGPWGTAPLLMLNVNGKRFCNEGAIAQLWSVCLRQPAGLACYVTDANWADTVTIAPLDHGAPNFGMDDYYDVTKASMDAVEVGNPEGGFVIGANLAERKMMGGTVFAAETLDELADMLGYEGDAKQSFLDSIAAYNELCYSDDGDTDYGKDKTFMKPIDTAPFYGGKGNLGHGASPMMVTMSGLVTDETQNVLKTDWTSIPGLYAAGNCLGGRYGFGYSTPHAGNSVGMAMTHGWLAGRTVAAI